jgi:hypothetical protein
MQMTWLLDTLEDYYLYRGYYCTDGSSCVGRITVLMANVTVDLVLHSLVQMTRLLHIPEDHLPVLPHQWEREQGC